jgi:hypothetical protein
VEMSLNILGPLIIVMSLRIVKKMMMGRLDGGNKDSVDS